MSKFKRFLAGLLAITVIAGFGLIAGATLSRIYDRMTGGVISADNDDAEFDNIYTELSNHVTALNPHTNSLDATGDTMTGNLVMDGVNISIYDGNDLKLYSDGGTTQKFLVDGATGDVTTTSNITVGGQYASTANTLSDATGTIAINWNDANVQYVELTGTGRTVTFANPLSGGRYVFVIKQGSGGSKTITTWPTIKWWIGSAPTLTTTAAHFDLISFVYDGTNYYGAASLNFY